MGNTMAVNVFSTCNLTLKSVQCTTFIICLSPFIVQSITRALNRQNAPLSLLLNKNVQLNIFKQEFFLAYFIADIGSYSKLKIVSFQFAGNNSQLKVTK